MSNDSPIVVEDLEEVGDHHPQISGENVLLLEDLHLTVNIKPRVHEAVQIVYYDEYKKSFSLREHDLQTIFEKVGSCPVAVYSIAGECRKGKSFILNFFVKHLRASVNNNLSNWLQETEDNFKANFPWQGGTKAHTKGIWMWDEPFVVDTDNGKVAILLIDTQGTNDIKGNINTSMILFGLSILISSVQIYNVMHDIGQELLDNLQLLTQFVKLVDKNSPLEFLQHLKFLVRDSQDAQYAYGLAGGKEYLDKLLPQEIKTTFCEVSCFLMPYPGSKVTRRSEAMGMELKLTDIDAEFLEFCEKLVTHLFTKENVVVKRALNNQPLGARELYKDFQRYFDILQSSDMPKLGTLMEETAQRQMFSIVQNLTEEYCKKMEKVLEEGFVEQDNLREKHVMFKQEMVNKYNDTQKFDTNDFINKYKTKLEQSIDTMLTIYNNKNSQAKANMENSLGKLLNSAVDVFKQEMQQTTCSNKYVDENTILSELRSCKREALHHFESNKEKWPKNPFENYKQELSDCLQEASEKRKQENRNLLDHLKHTLVSNSLQCLEIYKNAMDFDEPLDDNAFEQTHFMSKSNALEEFDRSVQNENIEIYQTKERLYLTKQIEIAYKQFKLKNEVSLIKELSTTKQVAYACLNLYTQEMEKVCGSKYKTENKMMDSDVNCKAHAWEMAEKPPNKIAGFTEKSKKEAEVLMINKFQDFVTENQHFKKIAIDDLTKGKEEAFENYKRDLELLEPDDNYIEEIEFRRKHDVFRQKVEQDYTKTFGKESLFPIEDFKQIKATLVAEISTYFVSAFQNNAHNRNRYEEKLQQKVESLKASYRKNIEQWCAGKFKEEGKLKKKHDELVKSVINSFRDGEIACPVVDIRVNNLKETLKELYSYVETKNNEHKSSCVIL